MQVSARCYQRWAEKMASLNASRFFRYRGYALPHFTGQSMSQGCSPLRGQGEKLTCLVGPVKASTWCQAVWGTVQGAKEGRRGLVGNDQGTKSGWFAFLLNQVEFVPELPKTNTSKIKRKELWRKEFGQV